MRPVTAQPGYTAQDVHELLATGQFVMAECFTITLNDGTTKYRYTTAQRNVSVVPLDSPMRVEFLAKEVLISGLRFRTGVGVEVDEQTVVMAYPEDAQIQFVNVAKALKLGYLDGARITRDRFFASDWGEPWLGGCPMFYGRVSTLDSVGRVEARLKVKSDLVLLNTEMPREVFQAGCQHTLFDFGCGLDRNLFVTAATVTAGTPTTSFLPWTGATAQHTQGYIHIENGDGVTLVRTIREAVAGVGIYLSYPLDYVPLVGDIFAAYPGCDRKLATCQTFFLNDDHYKGFPFVPVAETAA